MGETSLPLQPRWIQISILTGAACFLFALIFSAVFDPTIRLLHALQALIYIAVIVLTRRNNAWGFGAGFMISSFWNYINLFVTTFIKAGLDQLVTLLQTGGIQRPDLLIAVVAAGGHFLLLAACGAGFVRTRPKALQWGQFAAGGALSIAYFVAIIVATGPQYIELLRKVFRLG